MRRIHLNSLVTAAAVILALGSCENRYLSRSGETWLQGNSRHAVIVGQAVRTFLVHVPREPRRNRVGLSEPFPLVILLHGSGADGETIRQQSGFDSVAEGFRVVSMYPDGETAVLNYG